MPLVSRVLVLLLACALTPGLGEVVENAWHLVAAGHAAHASQEGPGHAPAGDEHGCSGAFHLCSCHHSLASDLIPTPAGPRPRGPREETVLAAAETFLEPDLPGLDRPPRA